MKLPGELIERRLDHQSGEAHAFYRHLQGPVRVGIEATVSHAQRLKALLRATASTFYHVQLLSAIAAAAVRTREK